MTIAETIVISDWISIARREFRSFLELKWISQHIDAGIEESFRNLESIAFRKAWEQYKKGEGPHPFDLENEKTN
jgi:hypothetical protein